MSYRVKEIFYTLQGEGANAGRPAVFCRFSGCNLWSGKEVDREMSICKFCDTDFLGTDGTLGGVFHDPEELARMAASLFPHVEAGRVHPFVVCTGGEPLLQLDSSLTQAFHSLGFEIGIETNGTLMPPDGIDWVCVSPKQGTELILNSGNELKLLFPQEGAMPESFELLDFQYFFLQPIDGPVVREYTKQAIEYCLVHPQWRLSIQTHKMIGIQ
jgi:7-carboxy-7-deazaguanine synthase